MATARFFLCIICYAFTGSSWMFSSRNVEKTASSQAYHSDVMARQEAILKIARAELNVRELTGHDGKRIGEYQASVGIGKGQPYCAAFVSWIFKQAGFAKPRTGWSPNLFPSGRVVKKAMPGEVLGIYFRELKRIAHCGLVEKVNGNMITSIEANTNPGGSREGDGVYRRIRHIRSIRYFSDWQNEVRNLEGGNGE